MLGVARAAGAARQVALVSPQSSQLLRVAAARALAAGEGAHGFATSAAAVEQAEAPKTQTKRSRVRKLRDPITLTDAAVARIKKLLERRPEAAGVRLGVKRKGCNGLSYTLDYADKFKFEDKVSKDGVTVGIDPKSLIYLVGSEMDYVEDELAAEFRFSNPNSKGNCGCGESFNV